MQHTHKPADGVPQGRFGAARIVALAIAGLMLAGTAGAGKPDGGDGEKEAKHAGKQEDKQDKKHFKQEQKEAKQEQKEAKHEAKEDAKYEKKRRHGERDHEVRVGGYFVDDQRGAVRDYYGQQLRSGHCPPGLAKKHNGCMPPGHARQWAVGQPLPSQVVYYPVPSPVVVRMGPPPSGYRYVRVATDILLISIGTAIVIDVIQDLGRG